MLGALKGEIRGFFITGRPGVGKSTIFSAIVDSLKSRGCTVGGIIAPEVRERGSRVGFKIVDLMTGESSWLAVKGSGAGGPRVGRYIVLEEAGLLGKRALERAVREAHVVGIDEIGPMELLLPDLRKAILEALGSGKPVVAVVHARLAERDPEVYRLVRGLGPIVWLTDNNRDQVASSREEVASRIASKAGCGEGGEGPSIHTGPRRG